MLAFFVAKASPMPTSSLSETRQCDITPMTDFIKNDNHSRKLYFLRIRNLIQLHLIFVYVLISIRLFSKALIIVTRHLIIALEEWTLIIFPLNLSWF